ncbi:MAG: hypothetical protein PVJ60_09095 [Phycisphaerales bacterium]|jgi:hypothetical protein
MSIKPEPSGVLHFALSRNKEELVPELNAKKCVEAEKKVIQML